MLQQREWPPRAVRSKEYGSEYVRAVLRSTYLSELVVSNYPRYLACVEPGLRPGKATDGQDPILHAAGARQAEGKIRVVRV